MDDDREIELIEGVPCVCGVHGNLIPVPCMQCSSRKRGFCTLLNTECRHAITVCPEWTADIA